MELMAQMMNPEKMGSIFQNINSVMEKKVESGELTQESLKNEANGMMGKMGNNDMFKNMMGQMNPEGVNNTTEPVQESSQESAQESAPELSREEKSKRLKAKIAEKRKNR